MYIYICVNRERETEGETGWWRWATSRGSTRRSRRTTFPETYLTVRPYLNSSVGARNVFVYQS